MPLFVVVIGREGRIIPRNGYNRATMWGEAREAGGSAPLAIYF